MTVKVTKPAVNLREKLAELQKPSGVAGEAMLRAETPQEQFNLIGAGRKNLIINGAMQVNQRGTTMSSFVNTNGTYHTVDRWAGWGSSGTYKIEQYVTSTSDLEIHGCKNYLKFNAGTGNNNCGIRQMVEDVTSIPSNSKITLSFYAKGTSGKEIETLIQVNYGIGGSAQEDLANSQQLFTLSSSWQRFTLTLDYTDLSGKTIGTESNIRVQFKQPNNDTSTSSWEMDITGVQLELGSVATPFEHRSYGEELALCMRYYEKMVVAGADVAVGFIEGDTLGSQLYGEFMVEKRATPSVGIGGTLLVAQGTGGQNITIASAGGNTKRFSLAVNHSALGSAGQCVLLRDVSGGYIYADAEL
jgi:hypothetical protein